MADPLKDDLGISAVAIETLERDFVEVMKELSAEDNLERFRLEYEKLHRALKKSHESEKRLIRKCQELSQEIMSNAAKVQSALRLSQEDETTITALRKEIEKAWKMVDAAHEKEARAKDTIHQLKKEVDSLKSLVEQGAGLTLGQETNLQDLIEERKERTKECDMLSQKRSQQSHELKEIQEKVRKYEVELAKKTEELEAKTGMFQQLSRETMIAQSKKEACDKAVQDLHRNIDKRSKECEEAKITLKKRHEELEKAEWDLKEERDKVHELVIKKEKILREVETQREQLKVLNEQNDQFQKSRPQLEKDAKIKEQEILDLARTKKSLLRAVQQQEEQIRSVEAEREMEAAKTASYNKQINDLLIKVEYTRREVENAERAVKDKVREKNLLISKAVREEGVRVKLEGERAIEQGKNRSLEQEVEGNMKENHRLRKSIYDLEEQRKKYQGAAQQVMIDYQSVVDQVKMEHHKAAQLQRDLEDTEKKLKNQQSMYEAVRGERSLNKKNLIEAQSEIIEMQKKLDLMESQIEQLKSDLARKENQLCKAHSEYKSLSEKFATEEKAVKHLETNYEAAKGRSDALAEEIKQLAQIIVDCDTEKAKQQMKFNSVMNERNILATQLIRRNDELTALYEKIKLQRSQLAKGEAQYKERLVDIRLLRSRVKTQRTSLRVALARIKSVEDLKRQITMLQRQLIHERTKVKALYEELQNPMNVHRWRKIEGSDPQVYENILKVHTLQQRLIDKTEEARAKDLVIQQKEKLYVDLKNILARQPGPEIAEQLAIYNESIGQRKEQLQKLSVELESSSTQVTEAKGEVDRLNEELCAMKKKYFDVKTKHMLLLQEKRLAATGAIDGEGGEFVVHHPPNQPRFAGGGFSLSQ